MGKYQMDMSKESEKKKVLPEGLRNFTITACEEQTSKAGNQMFMFTMTDEETRQEDEVYAIATPGKRWFLKQILAACGVPASEDGVYDWDIKDVIGKEVQGLVMHQKEKWVNREGEEVESVKSKIVEVQAVEPF